MFRPNYTITDRLLQEIKRTGLLIQELNTRRFPKIILVELEKSAREVSSYASTSIEGNPLPLTEVKKVLQNKPENIRTSEREVVNYNQALINLNKRLQTERMELSLKLILNVHSQIMNELLPEFETGKLRQTPVVVHDPRTGGIVYLPPDANDVPTLLTELVDYVNKKRNKVDPLLLAGIFHKQMVIIHPFTDGNGRTTRLVTKALLAAMGLNTFNLFSFENYYNKNVTKYFQTVGEYGNYHEFAEKIDFTPWLEYFTEGIIDELLRVTKLLPKIGSNPQTRLRPHDEKVLAYIRKNGFITDREYAAFTSRAKATRALDFQKLIRLGLIRREGKGRSTYYLLSQD